MRQAAYLKYMVDVLGVKEVISPDLSPEMNTPAINLEVWGNTGSSVLFLSVIKGSERSLKQNGPLELLDKMISAMKLDVKRVAFAEIILNEESSSITLSELSQVLEKSEVAKVKKTVIFSSTETISEPFGEWVSLLGSKGVLTFHPSHLLDNPDDKRATWAHLQKVM